MSKKLISLNYSSIFREDDERPAPTLPVPTFIMQVPQFSTSVVHRDLFSPHPQIIRWLAFFLAEIMHQFPHNGGDAYRLAFGHYMPNT